MVIRHAQMTLAFVSMTLQIAAFVADPRYLSSHRVILTE